MTGWCVDTRPSHLPTPLRRTVEALVTTASWIIFSLCPVGLLTSLCLLWILTPHLLKQPTSESGSRNPNLSQLLLSSFSLLLNYFLDHIQFENSTINNSKIVAQTSLMLKVCRLPSPHLGSPPTISSPESTSSPGFTEKMIIFFMFFSEAHVLI